MTVETVCLPGLSCDMKLPRNSRLVASAAPCCSRRLPQPRWFQPAWQMRLGLHWLVEHFLAYFVLTTMFCLAWHRPMAVAAVLLPVAILLEALQGLTPDRTADAATALSAATGVAVAALLADLAIACDGRAESAPPPGQKLKGGCWRGPSKCDVSSPDGDESATARNSGPDRRRHDRRRCADRRAVDDQYRHGRYRGHGRAGGGAGARGLGTCPHHGRPRRGGRRRASHQRASRSARGRSAARRRLPL